MSEQRDYEHEAAVGRIALKRVLYAMLNTKVIVLDARYTKWLVGAGEILNITDEEMIAFGQWQKGLDGEA